MTAPEYQKRDIDTPGSKEMLREALRGELQRLGDNWRLLFYDDFSTLGTGWACTDTGVPAIRAHQQNWFIQRDTERAYRRGGGSLRFKSLPIALREGYVNIHIGPHRGRMLYHVVWGHERRTEYVTFWLIAFFGDAVNGVWKVTGGVRYYHHGDDPRTLPGEWYVYANGGVWVKVHEYSNPVSLGDRFLGGKTNLRSMHWQRMDLTMDFANAKYESLVVNGKVFDLSAYDIPTNVGSAEFENMPIRIAMAPNDDTERYIWLGEVAVVAL